MNRIICEGKGGGGGPKMWHGVGGDAKSI
jgi:hypothetical protein